MLNNIKNLRWYWILWSLCMRMTSLTVCRRRCFGGCNFWKEISSKNQDMVPCEAFWHMDNTNINLSKIGSKLIAIRFCEIWNRISKACIALKPEGDEKWKPRNFLNSDQLCLTSTTHFWKMYRKWTLPNFQIYGVFFTIFSLQKHEIYQKASKIFSLYSMT